MGDPVGVTLSTFPRPPPPPLLFKKKGSYKNKTKSFLSILMIDENIIKNNYSLNSTTTV